MSLKIFPNNVAYFEILSIDRYSTQELTREIRNSFEKFRHDDVETYARITRQLFRRSNHPSKIEEAIVSGHIACQLAMAACIS